MTLAKLTYVSQPQGRDNTDFSVYHKEEGHNGNCNWDLPGAWKGGVLGSLSGSPAPCLSSGSDIDSEVMEKANPNPSY